jgi:acyl-coenzyme A synthetase/AMP-(fatty) acid ligase
MPNRNRAPNNIGLLFDWSVENVRHVPWHLDRPFDIAPEYGTALDTATVARIVRNTSAWLYNAGLRHGDHVAVVKENHFDILMIGAAAARIGAVAVLIAPAAPIDQIRALITRTGPSVVVAGTSVLQRAEQSGVKLCDASVPVVAVGEATADMPPGAVALAEVLGGPEAPVRARSDDEPMLVTQTSGTTGLPKLIIHSANSSLATFPYRIECLPLPVVTYGRSEIVATCIAFGHARALSWASAQLKRPPGSLVVISRPELDNAAKVLAAHPADSLEACPNIFQYWEELAASRPELFARVKRFISTFDTVHPRTVRMFLGASRRRLPLWEWGLAQSEIAGISGGAPPRGAGRPPRAAPHDATNVGWPPGVRVQVVDPETGRKQARGRPGLLMVAPKSLCLNYLGEDDRYRAKVHGKWWNTGDLGERVSFGRIKMRDREVDMIPGISCIELESILLDRLEQASEIVVIGVPGRRPIPVISTYDDQLAPEEWQRAKRGLPELEEPRLIAWEDIPRTSTWKVRRVELRERLLGTSDVLGTGKWT